jgi:hypothetical protein
MLRYLVGFFLAVLLLSANAQATPQQPDLMLADGKL